MLNHTHSSICMSIKGSWLSPGISPLPMAILSHEAKGSNWSVTVLLCIVCWTGKKGFCVKYKSFEALNTIDE